MPVSLTSQQIYDAGPALETLCSRDLPVELSFPLARMWMRIKPEWTVIVEERDKLLEKHAEKDAKGNSIVAMGSAGPLVKLGDNEAAFKEDERALFSQTIELECPTMHLSSFRAQFEMKPAHVAALIEAGLFIDDVDEKAESD